ncbi:hypothetical protein ACFL4H_00075 [Candidatus Neomarinimicrobiota bacterium]
MAEPLTQDNTPDNKVVPKTEASGGENQPQRLFTDDFFNQLDRNLEPNLTDPTLEEGQKSVLNVPESDFALQDNAQDGSSGLNTPESKTNDSLEKRLENVEGRYAASSQEAIRLKQELDKLKPIIPIVSAMQKDLAGNPTIRENLASGKIDSVAIKKRLGLPEDFQYDKDEAMNNPESKSAQYETAVQQTIIQSEIQNAFRGEKAKAERQRIIETKTEEENAFKAKYPDVDINDLNDYAEKRILTMEDIYILKNLDERDAQIAGQAKKEVFTKVKDTQNNPISLANASSQAHSGSPVERIIGIMKGLDSTENLLSGDQ